ncbi:MAG TPA: DUF952 domain-containing protein [Candidatus Dormibacteraeota bacterium]|nr:DUF952 domain-containing protein [Candidatus Dormibacteraeota bacterium]
MNGEAISLFHITTREQWNHAVIAGRYQAESLVLQGFIHLSTENQLEATARRHFADRGDLVVLEIDPARLRWEIRWEDSHGESYPHLYGPLETEAVIDVQTLTV